MTDVFLIDAIRTPIGALGGGLASILESEAVAIGMPVEMVTRRLRSDGDERGMIVYGYKFRPQNLVPAK